MRIIKPGERGGLTVDRQKIIYAEIWQLFFEQLVNLFKITVVALRIVIRIFI